jgi:ABC-type ATPase involved in cell division
MIRFQQAQIGYKKALISIENLELESSAIFALVGRNGSGKSTFLKTITGQISLLGGNLEIDSRSTKEVKAAELSRIISFVESKFDGVSFLSVEKISDYKIPVFLFLDVYSKHMVHISLSVWSCSDLIFLKHSAVTTLFWFLTFGQYLLM